MKISKTDEQIEALRDASVALGDNMMATICRLALLGEVDGESTDAKIANLTRMAARDKCARVLAALPTRPASEQVFVVAVNSPAHEGCVEEVSAFDERSNCRLSVIFQGTESACDAELEKWLECDSAEKGTYCYAHNSGARA